MLLLFFIAYVMILNAVSELLLRKLQHFRWRLVTMRIIFFSLGVLFIGIYVLAAPQLKAALARWTGYIPN